MFYKKCIKNKGMTLIETIVSMWILGIVVVSMLTFTGATMSKKNQSRIQAITIAKSELQDAIVAIQQDKQNTINNNGSTSYNNNTICDHISVYLLKSSYLISADENRECNIEEIYNTNNSPNNNPNNNKNDDFYTKYVIYDNEKKDNKNWIKVDMNTFLLDEMDDAFTIEKTNELVVNQTKPINNINYDYNKVLNLYNNTEASDIETTVINQKAKYEQYVELINTIEEANKTNDSILQTNKKYNDYNYGKKCFIVLTTYNIDSKDKLNSDKLNSKLYLGQTIPINVKVLWASEKKKNGVYPLDTYEIDSEVITGSDSGV